MFNLGRALHQMGLSHLAIHYYQKALELPAEKLEVKTPHTIICLRELAGSSRLKRLLYTLLLFPAGHR